MKIASFYLFQPLDKTRVKEIERELKKWRSSLRGLILLGQEGINGTVSGDENTIAAFETELPTLFESAVHFKEAEADRHPFRDFKIRLRKEIVTLGRPGLAPAQPENHHLTPEQWHTVMGEPGVVVLDTRNRYEVEIGKFAGAVDLQIDEFREFPERIKDLSLAPDTKVLMYCTGGIRCEKAILAMQEQGFENVYQLKGGILDYLKEFPNQKFEGECFVFDYRLAVDQKLQPSMAFKFCPHCGQPGAEEISCRRCGTAAVVCSACLKAELRFSTCSKNCAHHESIQSASQKPHRQELGKRHRDRAF